MVPCPSLFGLLRFHLGFDTIATGEYAEERLAEAQAMATQNKFQGLERAAAGYDKFLVMAAEKAEETRQQGVPEDLSERVSLATSKHLSVLDTVADALPEAVPEQARQAISRAKDASIRGMESALKGVARENPVRAAEISMAAIEARLNRAKIKAEENDAKEVEEAINEAEKLFEFGTEISEIAQGLGEGTTTVEQLVARATSIHLEILAEVYQRVPEQAKPAIESAMTRTATGREMAIEALKSKAALGNIPEEIPLPETVPPQVRERISKLRPEVTQPSVSGNATEETETPEGQAVPGRPGGITPRQKPETPR